MQTITSATNPAVKLARKLLKSSRERARSGKILLDGAHLISEYAARFDLSGGTVFVADAAINSPEIKAILDTLPASTRLLEVPLRIFNTMSPVETPTGIVAICDRPNVPEPSEQAGLRLLLDGIQDPGNLGSILRTATAMDVEGIHVTATCVDAWSPKCLRGGMGAQFVVPLTTMAEQASIGGRFNGKIIATSSHGGQPLTDADLSGPLLVMFGGEGSGLRPELAEQAQATLHIPLKNAMESLNVAAAVAIFCYERLRQTKC